jgi:hypothetical protein
VFIRDHLFGTAVLESMEDWISLEIKCDDAGRLSVSGGLGDQSSAATRLSYELQEEDQSHLGQWIAELDAMEREYPCRADPDLLPRTSLSRHERVARRDDMMGHVTEEDGSIARWLKPAELLSVVQRDVSISGIEAPTAVIMREPKLLQTRRSTSCADLRDQVRASA